MKKMNKTFLAGTAFAVSAAAMMSLSGCCCVPSEPTVYGPPEYFDLPSLSEFESAFQIEPETKIQMPTMEEIETDFTVETEIQEDVYGPPEWFD